MASKLREMVWHTILNTPHSCLTDEHCCALHAAHRAAADAVDKLLAEHRPTCPDCGAKLNKAYGRQIWSCVVCSGPNRVRNNQNREK